MRCSICGKEFTPVGYEKYCPYECRCEGKKQTRRRTKYAKEQRRNNRAVMQWSTWDRTTHEPTYMRLRSYDWLHLPEYKEKKNRIQWDMVHYMHENIPGQFDFVEIQLSDGEKIRIRDTGDRKQWTAKQMLDYLDRWYRSIIYQDNIHRVVAVMPDQTLAEIWKRILPEE